MSDEIKKIPPYNRLQLIFDEGNSPVLTKKGKSIIDDIIGKEEIKKTYIQKLIDFFKSIDNKIFPKGPRITNIYHRRK